MKEKYFANVFNTCTGQYEDIEVSEEVYRELMRSKWRLEKKDATIKRKEIPFSTLFNGECFDPADESTHIENEVVTKTMREKIKAALTEEEYDVIDLIVWQRLTEREYATFRDLPQTTVSYRKRKALNKIKKIFEKSCSK